VVGLMGDEEAATATLPVMAELEAARGALGSGGEALAADDEASATSIAESLAADAATAAGLSGDSRLRASLLAASAAMDHARAAGGHCLVTGLGKSGAVAARLAASLASTGYRAHFVHAAEWAHGDLGNMPHPDADGDVASALASVTSLIAISHSGRTAEVVGACKEAAARGIRVVLIAGGGDDAADSPAGTVASHVLGYRLPDGVVEPYGGAPTASIVAQEAVANALVRKRGLNPRRRPTPRGSRGPTPPLAKNTPISLRVP